MKWVGRGVDRQRGRDRDRIYHMLGEQEMRTKVYLESPTKNSARWRKQYTIKIRLPLSGWMDVKWITYPHKNIQHQTSMITLMDLWSWQNVTVECILFCLLSLWHTPEWQKVKLGKDREIKTEREKREKITKQTLPECQDCEVLAAIFHS